MRISFPMVNRLLAVALSGLFLSLWPVRSVRGQDALTPEAPPATAEAIAGDLAAKEQRKKEELARIETFGWKREGTGPLGQWAEIKVPRGYRFADGDGARKLLQAYGNLVGTSEQGLIAPENLDWFVVFDFKDMGYVKDDDKDKLDADALMKQKKENEKLANEERKRLGLSPIYLTGWVSPPHYNQVTHNLEWGVKLRGEEGGESVNYNMKLLGRKGVMDATVVCDPEAFDAVLPAARRLIDGFQFQSGQTYAEYRKGDKIAQYGLTALVVGGGAALAAKSGLLAVIAKFFGKFFKIIIAVLIACAVVVKKFFGGLFRRGRDPHQHDSLPPPPPPPS